MNYSIDVDIQYSVDDYSRGLRYMKNRNFLFKYAGIISLICLLTICGILFFQRIILVNSSAQLQGMVGMAIVPFAVMAILLPIIRYLPDPIQKWQVSRQFRSSPILKELQRISIDVDGIKGQTNLGQGETKWEAFIEATETKTDFYFFTAKKFALFIPKHSLASDESEQSLRKLTLEKLGKKADLLQ